MYYVINVDMSLIIFWILGAYIKIIFLETYYKPPPLSTRDREGPEALPGTLSERGITAGGLLHHHACLRSDA
jgi:hypothetical protein